jgi:hypothetical protein
MVNAVGAYKHLIAGPAKPGDVPTTGWDNNQLQKSKNPQNIYKITVAEPNEEFITATVIWNKHYNSVYPFEPRPDKDANLRLELWAVDTNDPENNYLLDYSDSKVDNVEHIYAQGDANYTHYELVVTFSNIDDPNQTPAAQRYGLAWDITKKLNKDNILLYDLNADGVVNDSDLTILVDNILTGVKSPGNYLLGDINADGVIDKKDFEIILKHKDDMAEWLKENSPK